MSVRTFGETTRPGQFFVIAFCGLLGLLHTADCQAQIVPYKLSGSGVADPTNGTFYGPAIATHLGKMTYFAQITSLTPILDEGGNLVGFDYTAIDTQTAADGSEICLEGAGSASLIYRPDLGPTVFEAVWGGEWTVVGGSGRFENVGPGTAPISLSMYQAPFDLFGDDLRPFVYIKTGDIDLGRRR